MSIEGKKSNKISFEEFKNTKEYETLKVIFEAKRKKYYPNLQLPNVDFLLKNKFEKYIAGKRLNDKNMRDVSYRILQSFVNSKKLEIPKSYTGRKDIFG